MEAAQKLRQRLCWCRAALCLGECTCGGGVNGRQVVDQTRPLCRIGMVCVQMESRSRSARRTLTTQEATESSGAMGGTSAVAFGPERQSEEFCRCRRVHGDMTITKWLGCRGAGGKDSKRARWVPCAAQRAISAAGRHTMRERAGAALCEGLL